MPVVIGGLPIFKHSRGDAGAQARGLKAAPRFTTDRVTADHTYLSAVGDHYVSLRSPPAP